MALLARCSACLAAALLTGCYSPSLRDCTVSCTATDDCASGQVCGTDHMCAAPSVAGSCGVPASDGGVDTSRDAAPALDAPTDAGPGVDLHIKVDGRGTVNIDLIGTCDSDAPSHGDCHFKLIPNLPATLREVESHGFSFDKWTGACTNGAATCVVSSPAAPIDVHAKFKND